MSASGGERRPPAWMLRVLGSLLPRRERDVMLGDVAEVFAARARRDGRPAALRWLARQVLSTPLAGLLGTLRLRRAGNPGKGAAPRLETLRFEVLHAARRISSRPLFVIASVAILAVGIAGTTTIFSVFSALLWPEVSVPDAERVHVLELTAGEPPRARLELPAELLRALREREVEGGLATTSPRTLPVATADRVDERIVMAVSDDYFDLLGVPLVAGRYPNPAAAGHEAVISHSFWRQRLDTAADALGRVVTIDRRPRTVVGIAAPGFQGLMPLVTPAAWIPVELMPGDHATALTRLEDAASKQALEARLGTAIAGIAAELELADPSVRLLPVEEMGLAGSERAALEITWGVLSVLCLLVLMVACANVGNLLLAQGLERSRELGIRAAIGASRGRLIGQLLTESSILAALAALAAVGLARLFLSLLPHWLPETAAGLTLRLDHRAVLLVVVLAGLATLGAGLAPALRVSRVGSTLSPLVLRGEGLGARGHRLSELLVGGQVAVSVVLLVLAILLSTSVDNLRDLDLGYEEEDRFAFSLELDEEAGYDERRRRVFVTRLSAALEERPEVAAVGLGSAIPVFVPAATALGTGPGEEPAARARHLRVDDGFIEALGIEIVRGDPGIGFEAGARGATVSRSLAERLWPDGEVIGRDLLVGEERQPYRVVAIVADGTYGGSTRTPIVFTPLVAGGAQRIHVVMRFDGPTEAARRLVGGLVRDLDPLLPLGLFEPVGEWFERAWLLNRGVASAARALGLLAIFIATVGLYARFAAAVAEREHEIGVRKALGASVGSILRLVVRHATVLALAGFAVGSLLAAASGSALGAFLFGVGPVDPASHLKVGGLVVAVAIVASAVPAMRAAATDPLDAMRSD